MTWPPNRKARLGLTYNPAVTCSCGRMTTADMMLDVTVLPAAVRGQRDELCDACFDSLVRNGLVDVPAFYEAHGAPFPPKEKARLHAAARAQST